jgi:hypothetical protein
MAPGAVVDNFTGAHPRAERLSPLNFRAAGL